MLDKKVLDASRLSYQNVNTYQPLTEEEKGKLKALILIPYNKREAERRVNSLSQGEIDVLEEVRKELGWYGIKCLALKYYPAFPVRKWWLEALRRMRYYARHPSITYLLYTLKSIEKWWRLKQEAFRESVNRLISLSNKSNKRIKINRLVPVSRLNFKAGAIKYFLGRYGHLVRR